MNTFIFQTRLGGITIEQFVSLLNDYRVLRFRASLEVHTLKKKRRLGEFEIADLNEVIGKTLVDEITSQLMEMSTRQVGNKIHPSRVVVEVHQIIYK